MATESGVLVLGQGSNDYTGCGDVISTDYFFVLKIFAIIKLYVMLQFVLD